MSNISKNTESQYILNGAVRNAPVEWQDVVITAEYDNNDMQPKVSTDSFVFNLQARQDINQWISNGLTGGVGIFEGMNLDLRLYNQDNVQKIFEALIDFTNDYKNFPDDGETTVSLKDRDGLDNFFEQLTGTTYGYLEEIGVFTQNDYITIPYVVEKKFNLFEILMSSIVLYLMVKELAVSVRNTADGISSVVALFSIPLGGQIGAAIRVVAITLINLIYTAILLLAIIDMSITLFNTLIQPKREHKGLKLKTALEKVANHFGYDFVAPISEYNNVYFLPSNQNADEKAFLGFISVTRGTSTGIPNLLDYGYLTEDMFKLGQDLPYAKMGIFGNTIHLRPQNDPFWLQQSQWVAPDVLIKTDEYNTDELKATLLLTFITDLNDEWTIDDYFGTSVEVRTAPITVINPKSVLIKGLNETRFPVTLGNRKNDLNAIERLLKSVGIFIDTVTGAFGGGSNFAGQVESKIGVLKVSSNWHSIPKLLWLNEDGTMPTNHRTLWNTDVLYEKYHKEKSFVRDNWHGQKVVYNDVIIPFGLEDFLILLSNPYFNYKGQQAKMKKFDWTYGKDEAKISFFVRNPYTYNLREFKIIPH